MDRKLAALLARGRQAVRDMVDASDELDYSDAASKLAQTFQQIDELLSTAK